MVARTALLLALTAHAAATAGPYADRCSALWPGDPKDPGCWAWDWEFGAISTQYLPLSLSYFPWHVVFALIFGETWVSVPSRHNLLTDRRRQLRRPPHQRLLALLLQLHGRLVPPRDGGPRTL